MASNRSEYKAQYMKTHPEYVNAVRRKSYAVLQIKSCEQKLVDADDIQKQKYLAKIRKYENNLAFIEQELAEIRKKYGMRKHNYAAKMSPIEAPIEVTDVA